VDGRKLSNQVRKYGKKVLAEDTREFGVLIPELVGKFYRHYAKAIIEHTKFLSTGYLLLLESVVLEILVKFWKNRFPKCR
jgi:hypothetical protein